MHTSEELVASDFDYRSEGQSVSRSGVMPPITPTDRVGVVMGAPSEGLDAGNFVLSCVTAFYDRLREAHDDFFEYPGYYTFQTTTDPADYRMLDIYPDHKNVVVEPETETLVQSITDRAIDILLVPNSNTEGSELADITYRSAERQIDYCYQYAGTEQLDEFDFSIGLPRHLVKEWYETTIDSVDDPSATNRQTVVDAGSEQVTQRFRRIGLESAVASLPVQAGE